ncbi:FHA domain-containing protein [Roseobacter sp. EG26]|uniref:FHA domain-containing protein n=1 Tax=Roseobacter sp. EG26 TaxID=3412477 RepID=UPI003CE56A02
MTLFRKVFQNQSRPATGDEALDEDAIRDAFMIDSEDRVLPLDPFAVAEERAEELSEETAEEHSELTDVSVMPEDVDAELEIADDVLAEEGVEEIEAADQDEEETQTADIAAVLAQTRMMEEPAAPTANEAPAVTPSVASDDAPAAAAEEVEPHEAQDEASSDEPAQEKAPDLVAYAKQQMSALGEDQAGSVEVESPPVDLSNTDPMSGVPAPVAGRAGRRAGRVKTRLLGFNRAEADANDPFGDSENATAKPQHEKFPVGWLVVVEGPGIGHSFSIFTGASMIGRGDDQVIKLDFGDNSISRHNHAAIAYDEEENKFYIGHGGKSNIIRRNARPVLSTEELLHADLLRIGETTLRFVALCGSDFKWDMANGSDDTAL